ncbi:MAG: hypothetical protein MMC33_007128 [Icmadophila ericetorum]|nr:hypothetical protein [Icmadophila ericetorum]
MPHYHLHARRQQHHHHDQNPDPPEDPSQQGVATIISVIYQTASATFDGPVGGYTTLLPTPEENTTTTGNPFIPETPVPSDTVPHTTAVTTASPIASSVSHKPSAIATHSAPNSESTTLLNSIQVTTSPTLQTGSPTQQATSSSTNVAAGSQASGDGSTIVTGSSSHGLTGGAKAGIAIGVIIGLAALLALFVFGYCRKMRQNEEFEGQENEKNPFADAAVAPAPMTVSTAPQLSLSPVTQFQPEVAGLRKPGDTIATATAAALTQNRDIEKVAGQTDDAVSPINPFDEASTSMPLGTHSSPFSQGRPLIGSEVPAPLRIRTPTPEASAAAAAADATAAAVTQRHNALKPLEINHSPSPLLMPEIIAASPTGTEFSVTSVSSGVAAGSAPISNVHRVQLDFKPSMEDELELRAGQLVRLLHEYDDGWALCIRMDRSQQGVAPRTCLSTRPVKPRPKQASGPPGPRIRGPPPQNSPLAPTGARGFSSTSIQSLPSQAPGFCPKQRSMSPGPYGGGPQRPNFIPQGSQRRSNSAGSIHDKARVIPGPSPLSINPPIGAQAPQGIPAAPVTPPPDNPPKSPAYSVHRKPVGGQST